MKLRFVLVRYLANLQFAIILLLTIASFSILGSIIEQDQPIDFYKNADVSKNAGGYGNYS